MPAAAPEPHLIVLFGGKGDLAERKILPALQRLAEQDLLGASYRILAVGRSPVSDVDFRRWAADAVGGGEVAAWCEDCLFYQAVPDFSAGSYAALADRIRAIEEEAGLPGNRTFYLALPPVAFGPTVTALGEAGLSKSAGFTRVVIEKPFGHDLKSAIELSDTIHAYFDEEQVYRIDHYLGKETVQNLLVFRFGNAVFEELWNRDRIRSVAITVAEDLGVEDRAAFYEKTGAVRDILQNHLVQILALTAMEVPAAFDAPSVRYEKVKVLRSIGTPGQEDVVFGRYTAGTVSGEEAPGYLEAEGVPPDSTTETFAAIRLELDNWRWQGVPFYVRTGKRLPRKLTEIAVTFRRPPVCLFESMGSCMLESNVLLITLQPDEGFTFHIDVKAPGEPLTLKRIPLAFRYGEEFGALPDAYETLILDVLTGDQTLFVHSDEVEASWRLFDPMLADPPEIEPYPAGSWGPAAAQRLVTRDGNEWSGS